MNKNIIAVIIIAIVVVGIYLFLRTASRSVQITTKAPNQEASQTPMPPFSETPAAKENVVTYTDSGYSPSSITIKNGDTVTFKNKSSQSMWTASAIHPSHRLYSGTSLDEHCPDTAGAAFDACKGILPGRSWSFTFSKTGTWKYHNHMNAGDFGTIIVE